MKPRAISGVVEFTLEETSTRGTANEDTKLERGLGVTGDDGVNLLEAAEAKFGVSFGKEKSRDF